MIRRLQISRRELKSTSDHKFIFYERNRSRLAKWNSGSSPTMLGRIALHFNAGLDASANETTACSQDRRWSLARRYAPHCRTV